MVAIAMLCYPGVYKMNYTKQSTRYKIHKSRVLTHRIKHAMLSSNGELVVKLAKRLQNVYIASI